MNFKSLLLLLPLTFSIGACELEEEDTFGNSEKSDDVNRFDQKIQALRKIPDFRTLEAQCAERWTTCSITGDPRQVSQSFLGQMNINHHIIGTMVPTMADERELPEWIANFEGDDYWREVDKFRAEWPSEIPFSWERVIVHELMHSLYSQNALINDHHRVIAEVNVFMKKYFDEFPRHLYKDGPAL